MNEASRVELRGKMFDLAIAELEIAVLGTWLTGSITVQCHEGVVKTLRMGGSDGVIIWRDGKQEIAILPSVRG